MKSTETFDLEETMALATLETHMHSLEANASPGVSSHRSVVDVPDCHIAVASHDIGGGSISPNINVATPNLVTLRRPSCFCHAKFI